MTRKTLAVVFFACMAIGTQALGLDRRYPDWPCVQLKVPTLTATSIWSGPSLDAAAGRWAQDKTMADLVTRIAARRTSMEEVGRLLSGQLKGPPDDRQDKATLLFAGIFEKLDAQRTEIMNGLERFSRRQQTLAATIRTDVAELRTVQDQPAPDAARLQEMTGKIQWETRIFEDRRASTTSACEIPVLIEQRLYAIGQTIQGLLQ